MNVLYVTSNSKNNIKVFVMIKLQVEKESIRLTKTMKCAVSQQLTVMKYQMACFQMKALASYIGSLRL